MAYKTTYDIHHNFPKLAEECGFTFNIHKPRVRVDWCKIRSIDLEKVVRDTNVVTIEHYIQDVLDCSLESEFDVRILDEGVVKLFRIAQLAVEYQQFCRFHLDRSIKLLREELITVMQDYEKIKKDLKTKEDELRKIRKKAKYFYKAPSQFGNENIATMILKTLSKNGDILSSPCPGNTIQNYNKCKYCSKVFLNQLYLNGHMSRRHFNANINNLTTEALETGEQDKQFVIENKLLNDEITELRNKLKDMESKIVNNETKFIQMQTDKSNIIEKCENEIDCHKNDDKEEVNNEKKLLDKFEEWKIQEQEKYKTEINLIKDQIIENINTIKEKNDETSLKKEMEVIQQLHTIIKEQNYEISALKSELTKAIKDIAKSKRDLVKVHQEVVRVDRAQQYEELTDNWNVRPKTLHTRGEQTSQCLADAATCTESPSHVKATIDSKTKLQKKLIGNNLKEENQRTLDDLHRKTQELLNFETDSSSDISSSSEDSVTLQNKRPQKKIIKEDKIEKKPSINIPPQTNKYKSYKNPNMNHIKNKNRIIKSQKRHKDQKEETVFNNLKDDVIPSSPQKLLRVKITEEVHKRLVTAGVDPLKSGVQCDVFQKQRILLRQEEELKKKKTPSYEKIKHSILAFLDTKLAEESAKLSPQSYKVITHKTHKNFNLSSVLSNVKSKAISLIKQPLEKREKVDGKYLKDDIIKKAELLLKTPPSSVPISPISLRQSSDSSHPYTPRNTSQKVKETKSPIKISYPKQNTLVKEYITDSDNSDTIENIHDIKKHFDNVDIGTSIEHLVQSPAKRPATVTGNYSPDKKIFNNDTKLLRAQSTTNIFVNNNSKENIKGDKSRFSTLDSEDDNDQLDSKKKIQKSDDIFIRSVQINTKSVLKNAPSTSSLNKKKVLFDLDANQMKSVSASPSQSVTDKSDLNIEINTPTLNFEEEWDISSIESVPDKPKRVETSPQKSLKVAELTQRIESQLARRGDMKPPGVGSVDVLRGLAGGDSNTSFGSSLVDDGDEPIPKPNKIQTDKDASDLDLSEFSIDGPTKNYKISFK